MSSFGAERLPEELISVNLTSEFGGYVGFVCMCDIAIVNSTCLDEGMLGEKSTFITRTYMAKGD